MPRTTPAAELAGRLIDALAAARASGRDSPIPLDELAQQFLPPPDPALLAKAVTRKPFTSRAVVALKGRPDSPVALLDDGDRLAADPRLLDAALRTLGETTTPPWTLSKVAGKLPPALRPKFLQVLTVQINTGRLPPFAVATKKGAAVRLHHRDRPPPPPKHVAQAGHLVDLVRQRRAAGGYPLTLNDLADVAGLAVADGNFKKALKEPMFAEQVVWASGKNAASPLALRDDLSALAGSELLLNFLLGGCERLDAHAFPIKDLLAKVEDVTPKVKNPLRAAVQTWLESEGLERALPAGIGMVLVGAGRKPGQRHFLKLEHMARPAKPASSSPGIAPVRVGQAVPDSSPQKSQAPPDLHERGRIGANRSQLSAPFAATFDAEFRRLDHASGANNFVSLVRLRQALAQVPRAEFDAGLMALRQAGRYWLTGAEGYDGISPEERAAGIPEAGALLLNVSRARP